jgi:hypothetical protein
MINVLMGEQYQLRNDVYYTDMDCEDGAIAEAYALKYMKSYNLEFEVVETKFELFLQVTGSAFRYLFVLRTLEVLEFHDVVVEFHSAQSCGKILRHRSFLRLTTKVTNSKRCVVFSHVSLITKTVKRPCTLAEELVQTDSSAVTLLVCS